MKFDFDEETHTYSDEYGNVIPSVTQILSMCHTYSDVNPSVLQQAAARGTAVHEACELIDYGVPVEDLELEPEAVPYVQAYLAFLRDYRPKWKLIEYPMASKDMWCAGTLDRYGEIDGKNVIVDLKTTASATREVKISWMLQVYCYASILYEYSDCEHDPDDAMTVQLKKDGTYTVHTSDSVIQAYNINPPAIMGSLVALYHSLKGDVPNERTD